MSDEYDYGITTEELVRPIGSNLFVAKAHIVKRISPTQTEPVSLPIAEALGVTEEEAYTEMEGYVKEWIANNQ